MRSQVAGRKSQVKLRKLACRLPPANLLFFASFSLCGSATLREMKLFPKQAASCYNTHLCTFPIPLISPCFPIMWIQKTLHLRPRSRGFHLITDEILKEFPEIARIRVGLMHIFIKHTSASLVLNENADPTVRADLEEHFNRHLAPADMPYFRHIYEGPDDMPAHIKSVLVGSALTLPITDGRLNLGTWQGIYLGEHRDRARSRRIVVTIFGE